MPADRSSNLGEDATAAVEGDTPRMVSKDLRNGKPDASANPGFDPASSEKGTKVRDHEGAITRSPRRPLPRITPVRRRGRRGAVGRRRERRLAWAVFLAPVFYWVTRQRRVAD